MAEQLQEPPRTERTRPELRVRRNIWLSYESGDMDYHQEINSIDNPEIISAQSVDLLMKEKQQAQTGENPLARVDDILRFIKSGEKEDALIRFHPGNYPQEGKGCCCFF